MIGCSNFNLDGTLFELEGIKVQFNICNTGFSGKFASDQWDPIVSLNDRDLYRFKAHPLIIQGEQNS